MATDTKKHPMDNITRCVHLDFHTSPEQEDIGVNFSKEDFCNALKQGNVQSITVFAKCHHSMCYYPTKIGKMHPHLKFDLLGAQIEAAHSIGVKAPIYITAGWSHEDAAEHPEWFSRDKDGNPRGYAFDADDDEPKLNCKWTNLCLNDGTYCQHIYALTEEVCQRYKDVDGLFYDICFQETECYCDECKAGMKLEGLDPESEDDARKYFIKKRRAFMKKCNDIVKKYHKNGTVFFNGGAEINNSQYHEFQSHIEMEDLPTAWGGYNKLPIRARYMSRYDKPYLGMTGKFHLAWGEFGGFKCKEALKFEIATMATYGAGASIGDHLFSDGVMDKETYKNIGYAYSYLEKIEPYCYGGRAVSNLGLYISPNVIENYGMSDILLENQLDFDVITDDNFEDFDTVIFPGGARLEDESLAKLNKFIANGGKVLFCHGSLLKKGEFQIDCGLKFLSEATRDCDYICAERLDADVPKSPFLTYIPALLVENVDAEVYAEAALPLYSRTHGHFYGHGKTPYSKTEHRYPAMTKKGNVVYVAHKIATTYRQYGSIFHKRYLIAALELLGYKPLVKMDIGSEGRATLRSQPKENRYCINMVYASPVKRGCAEIIDDIMPVYSIDIEVTVPENIKAVRTVIGGEQLPFEYKDGVCKFTVPKLHCHEAVVLEY